MWQTLHIAVVIPAYNEERLIAATVRSIPSFVDCIIVVDDGSSDGTRDVLQTIQHERMTVLHHPRNRGVGAAIATGYRHAFEVCHADIAAVVGGDAQMDPNDLPALLAPIAQDTADYVKGNRLQHHELTEQMPLERQLGNHLLSWATRLCTGLTVEDTQCGFTALSARAAATLDLQGLWPRYGYPNDLLSQLAVRALRVQDVPVRPIYGDEQSGIGARHLLFHFPFVLARCAVRRLKPETRLKARHYATRARANDFEKRRLRMR